MDSWNRSSQLFMNGMLSKVMRYATMNNPRYGLGAQPWPDPSFANFQCALSTMPARPNLQNNTGFMRPVVPTDMSYMSLLVENQLLKSQLKSFTNQEPNTTKTETQLLKLESQQIKKKSQLTKIESQSVKTKPEFLKEEPEPNLVTKLGKPKVQTLESVSESSKQAAEEKCQNLNEKDKKKRYRRFADQVLRTSYCPVPNCRKSYGAEGTLHQHIRIKHPEFDLLTWIHYKIKASKAPGNRFN